MSETDKFQLKQSCTYFMVLAEKQVGVQVGVWKFKMLNCEDKRMADYWRDRISRELDTFRDYVRAAFPGNQELENRSFEHIDHVADMAYDEEVSEYHNA